ncbi:phosphate ABC transporter permease PstA [Thiotrichales bacterium 19S9-12]|nr:phosphate ABC transporter permease PstA [Thiotrichales bacterium 19S9-11]MCF6810898.1 phosphate ABC transporter permease PstA [Thiotrichales bacterium 19S9-12]
MNFNERTPIKRKIKSSLFKALCWISAFISVLVLLSVLLELFTRGMDALSFELLIHDTRSLGLRNAIIGSLIMTLLSIIVITPIAILIATFLVECRHRNRLVKTIRFINDILLSTPSVIVGIFIYTLIVAYSQFSAIAGICALSIIALPIIVRASEDVLFLVSPMLKEAAIALGVPKWKVIIMIVYRSAKSGLITAVILATARIMGESAPLLFTSAKNSFLSFNLTEAMESLPVMIFENAMQPYPQLQNLAWTGALIITVLVLIMNLSARWVAKNK